jgi:hypothetical protein
VALICTRSLSGSGGVVLSAAARLRFSYPADLPSSQPHARSVRRGVDRESIQQSDCSDQWRGQSPHKQSSCVRCDKTRIKSSDYLPGFNYSKIELFCATLCLHRGFSRTRSPMRSIVLEVRAICHIVAKTSRSLMTSQPIHRRPAQRRQSSLAELSFVRPASRSARLICAHLMNKAGNLEAHVGITSTW